MGPEGSLPRLQVPVNCLFPETHQSSPSPILLLDILILASHLRLGGSSAFFPSGFPAKTLYALLLSPYMCYMPHPSHSSWFDYPNNIWRGVETIKLLVMLTSPLPCYLVPLMPKYSPQHSVIIHPQPTFLPQCERPSFTPIKSNRQNYSSIFLNLYFWIANWKTKDSALNVSKHSLTSI